MAAMLVFACSVDAAAVAVEVRPQGDVTVIEATADIRARADVAWRVLTDYARYAEFVPGLRSSSVKSRSGARVIVEQSGHAQLGWLELPIEIVYEITEFAPDRLRSLGTIADVGSLESDYGLIPSVTGVRLTYVGRLATRSAILRPIEHALGQRTILRQFQALADEIERSGNAATLHSSRATGPDAQHGNP